MPSSSLQPDEIHVRPLDRIGLVVRSCSGPRVVNYEGTVKSAVNDFPSVPVFLVDSLGNKTRSL